MNWKTLRRKNEESLTAEQRLVVDEKLLKGTCYRSAILFLLFGVAALIYGAQSLPILHLYKADISLWDNLWPRLFFNTVPCFLAAFISEKTKIPLKFKAYLWAFGFPAIYLCACMTYVWPLMNAGHQELYLYVHGANLFCISLSFILVAPSLRWMLTHFCAMAIMFYTPVIYLLHSNTILVNLFINDSINSLGVAFGCGYFMHRLRYRLAVYEVRVKDQVTPFLGNNVADAIYNNQMETLNDRVADGLILSIDIRGYTNFRQSSERAVSANFMREYHTLVNALVGRFGGFVHKSNGDGHLISFGVMDDIADLSDIPGLETEIASANALRMQQSFARSMEAMTKIIEGFTALKAKYVIEQSIKLGCSVASGPIEVKLQGDGLHRKELDIDGEAIVRGTRLEAYTKVIGLKLGGPESSYLVISPELVTITAAQNFKLWEINDPDLRIRDYPNIDHLYYLRWMHAEEASTARAS